MICTFLPHTLREQIMGWLMHCHTITLFPKLDFKSEKCMFLGYSENRKGYPLYDFQKQRVVFSLDVVFNEIAGGFEKELNDLKLYVKIDLESIDSRTSTEPDEERAESGNEQEKSTEELVQ